MYQAIAEMIENEACLLSEVFYNWPLKLFSLCAKLIDIERIINISDVQQTMGSSPK